MPPSSTVLTVASRHREVLTVRSSAMWWVFVLLRAHASSPTGRSLVMLGATAVFRRRSKIEAEMKSNLKNEFTLDEANEAFEKVESYGLVPNMINYLMKDYKIGVAKGTTYSFFGLQHPVLLLFWCISFRFIFGLVSHHWFGFMIQDNFYCNSYF
ncbi:hypothetical protein R6Q59_000096 [Mikania micrantha]